ncbi:MAG: hypothetical protein OIN87_02495 [Candidatus Methanoperedens sp.]|nr:hypothetical protein [Candidatus Methanoperedens sp.]
MTIRVAQDRYGTAKRHISHISEFFLIILVLVANVQAADLILDPSMGDSPSVSGTLNGRGWLCDSGLAPAGDAIVSGTGIAGTATIDRSGILSGSFTLRGDAGQSIRVTVTSSASCPSGRSQISLEASSIFTFNAPTLIPTRSVTPAPSPVATPIPAATSEPRVITTAIPSRTASPTIVPSSSPAPSPSVPSRSVMTSDQVTISIIGCSPSTGKVQARFDPVNAKPGSSSFTVPAVQVPGQTGSFAMDVSKIQGETVYKVLVISQDPGCTLSDTSQAYWLPGRKLNINAVRAGKTQLWTNPSTIANGEMLNWMKEITIEGYANAKKVPFKVETELKGVQALKLQASYFPMPTDINNDPMSPQGLITTWDIDQTCATCTFTVDISDLLPPQPQVKKSFTQKGIDSIQAFFKSIGNGAKTTVQYAGNLLSGGAKSGEMTKIIEVIPLGSTRTSLGNYVQSKGNVLLPTTFYFRIVLLDKNGKPAGNPSNSVKISWSSQINTGGTDFKLPAPVPGKPDAKWDVEVLSYHGLLRPKKSESCFIVTEDSTGQWAPKHYNAPGDPSHISPETNGYSASSLLNHKYFKGDIICQPDPPKGCGWSDPSACITDIADFFQDAINWVSKAYDSAKNTAVGFVADGLGAIPGVSEVCKKSCLESVLSTGMDVALTSMGVPPSLPNFAELEDQGLDYLAEQAIANSPVPQEALDAAKVAGFDPKEEIKKGIKKGLTETQKSYAGIFNWLPEGVPVQPDGPQMPVVTLNVIRSKNDQPGECNGGGVSVDAYATMSGDFPGYKPYHPSYLAKDIETLDLKAGGSYRVFEHRYVSLPCVAPGSSLVIPVVLNPLKPHVGLNPPDTGYFWWLYPYAKSGELRIKASGSNEIKFNIVPNDPKW